MIDINYHIKTTTENIDWERVAELLYCFGLSNLNSDMQQKAFENSYAVAFAFDGLKLIGVGRALSDGVCQASIYNIALDIAYHGQDIGKAIIYSLIEQVKQCNIILYTHPKTVSLYEHLGFRRMKTGMAIYKAEALQAMEEMGFLLPEKYRFGDNHYERET